MLLLLFVFFFREFFERRKGLLPKLGKVVPQQRDALGI